MNNSQQYFKELYLTNTLNKREIDFVICYVLNINTAGLFIYDKEISKTQKLKIKNFLQQRIDGKPLAYIVGYKEFWTLKLKVNKHTLIPRPETEQIVELILKWTSEDFSGDILDLGTGTGAIALSVAEERPLAQVTASDFSGECVEVAKYNQKHNNIENVSVVQSNWFENIVGKYDYIVSNPPYIVEEDEHLLNLKYEPITALTAKENGLADIKHIIINSKNHLKHDGCLIIEHGYNQASAVQQFFSDNKYNKIKTYIDLAGIPRITSGKHSNS